LSKNLAISRKYKDEADSALLTFERFASVAAGLGIVFAVAPWIKSKEKPVVASRPKTSRKKTKGKP
jgi:hypothetical protein